MAQFYITDSPRDFFEEVIEADTEEEAIRIFEQSPNHGKVTYVADLTDTLIGEE